jgi:hypothetical protein
MSKFSPTFISIAKRWPHQIAWSLIGAIALLQPAAAKTPVEINSTTKAMTVMISGQDEQGTGVIVQRQGKVYTLLTAAHVLKNEKYQITTPDNRQYRLIPGSIRKVDGDIDLAIGKFIATTNYSVAKLGNSAAALKFMWVAFRQQPRLSPNRCLSSEKARFRPAAAKLLPVGTH